MNKQKLKVEIAVETVDSDMSFQKLLMAPTTILYVVRGVLEVFVESAHVGQKKIQAGQTLIIEGRSMVRL